MFIPQLDESDIFDKHGRQVGDINSLAEYIDNVVLGHDASNAADEDNDNPYDYHVTKVNAYSFSQQSYELKPVIHTELTDTRYPEYIAQDPTKGFDLLTIQPPKA
jgi:hypothetical protein